jgi:hypothetical protein
MKYMKAGKICLPMVFCFLMMPFLEAQSDSIKRPLIGNHIFTPVTYSNLPLTNTFISTSTGLGSTSGLVTKPFNLPVTGRAGEVSFVEMGLTYQQSVRDWMAAYIDITVSSRVGTEVISILAQELSTVTSFKIGWRIKLTEGKKSMLSMIFELQNLQGSFTNVLGFVEDIIKNHPNPSLNKNVPILGFATGFQYAYAIGETMGLKTSGKLAYGQTFTRGVLGFAFDVGAGIDLNFYPRYSIPIGLVAIYNITSMPEFVYVNGEHSQLIQTKIAYTKASDFCLGIEFSYMKYPFPDQDKPVSVWFMSLAARYYF